MALLGLLIFLFGALFFLRTVALAVTEIYGRKTAAFSLAALCLVVALPIAASTGWLGYPGSTREAGHQLWWTRANAESDGTFTPTRYALRKHRSWIADGANS